MVIVHSNELSKEYCNKKRVSSFLIFARQLNVIVYNTYLLCVEKNHVNVNK